jgi:transposase
MSWKETAGVFSTSWDSVYRAVQWVVHWGIAHRDLTGIESIGIDEIQHRRGHHYLTLVYQLDQGCKRLLCVRKERTEASLRSFFDLLDAETIKGIKYACTDMWPAYLKVLRERATGTMNILDRFHIMKKFSEALDKMLERHEPLLLNWFEARGLSSGIVEGFNNKAKLTMRKSYGFKEVETISTALYHQLGDLPEPIRTHKFC